MDNGVVGEKINREIPVKNLDIFNRIFSIFLVCVTAGYMSYLGYDIVDISTIIDKLAYLSGGYILTKEIGSIIKK